MASSRPLRARREVDYKATTVGTGTPAWLKAENKAAHITNHEDGEELAPRALLSQPERDRRSSGSDGGADGKKKGVAAAAKDAGSSGGNKDKRRSSKDKGGSGDPERPKSAKGAAAMGGDDTDPPRAREHKAPAKAAAAATAAARPASAESLPLSERIAAAKAAAAAPAAKRKSAPAGVPAMRADKEAPADKKKARASAPAYFSDDEADWDMGDGEEPPRAPSPLRRAAPPATAAAAPKAAAKGASAAAALAAARGRDERPGSKKGKKSAVSGASGSQFVKEAPAAVPERPISAKGKQASSAAAAPASEAAASKEGSKAGSKGKSKASTGGGSDAAKVAFAAASAPADSPSLGWDQPQGSSGSRKRKAGSSEAQRAAAVPSPDADDAAAKKRARKGGSSTSAAASAPPAPAPAVGEPAPSGSRGGGILKSGKTGSAGGAGPSAAAVVVAPVAPELAAQDDQDYAKLARQYRRLLEMYGSLKSQKIGALEALVEEQDQSLTAVREEVRRSEEFWKREARMQRQAAASVQAEETQRRIKFMQDELTRAKEAVLEAERALKEKELELLERDALLAEMEAAAAVGARGPVGESIGVGPTTASAGRGSAQTPAVVVPSPGVGCQFPTPPAPPVPSPGVGVQFPTPYETPGGINAAHFGPGPAVTQAADAACGDSGPPRPRQLERALGGGSGNGASGSGSPVQGLMSAAVRGGDGSGGGDRRASVATALVSAMGARRVSPLQRAVAVALAAGEVAAEFAFAPSDGTTGAAQQQQPAGTPPAVRDAALQELRAQLATVAGDAAAGRARPRQSLAPAAARSHVVGTPQAVAAAFAGFGAPAPSPAAVGLRAPANTPAPTGGCAGTPLARRAATTATMAPPAGSACSRRFMARTPAATAAAASPTAACTPQRNTTPRGSLRSASASLVPIRYLFGLDVKEPPAGQKGVLYTHRATGFTFQLGPAPPASSVRAEGDDSVGQVGWEEEGEEEEVAFVPVALGSAGDCLPEFLKEPITFGASRKEQLVKIIFDSLASARTHGKGNKGAAAAPAQAAGKENACAV